MHIVRDPHNQENNTEKEIEAETSRTRNDDNWTGWWVLTPE